MSYNPLLSDLIEIFDGYSRFDLNGQALFFRHFGLRDQRAIGSYYEKYRKLALSRGIETQEQARKRLEEEGDWLSKDDLEISELEEYISNMKKTKEKLLLPSQREALQKTIDEDSLKLAKLIWKKNELMGTTCEDYASKRSNEEFLRLMVHSEDNLKEQYFSEDDFGSLPNEKITELSGEYQKMCVRFSEENIQKIVLQDFFNMYVSSCENPYVFFGKFICDLTSNQMKLLLYARIFHNIFQYNEDMPDYIKKDPKAIFEFVESKRTRERFQSETCDDSATVVFGATAKDIDILDPHAKKVSLSDALHKNGGSLDMEQMMDLLNG